MKRINLYIEDSMFIQLKGLPGTMTENVKAALRDFLKEIYIVNASTSQSTRKEDK